MKIKQLLLLFVVMLQITSIKTIAHENYESNKAEYTPIGDEVFTTAAQMPSFPGGEKALYEYCGRNIRYPAYAADNNIQGTVIVKFVVEKDGKIGEVKIVRGVDKDLDREAIRVCKTLPKFSPGRNENGDPVRVWVTMPFDFYLIPNSESSQKKWVTLTKDFNDRIAIFDVRINTDTHCNTNQNIGVIFAGETFNPNGGRMFLNTHNWKYNLSSNVDGKNQVKLSKSPKDNEGYHHIDILQNQCVFIHEIQENALVSNIQVLVDEEQYLLASNNPDQILSYLKKNNYLINYPESARVFYDYLLKTFNESMDKNGDWLFKDNDESKKARIFQLQEKFSKSVPEANYRLGCFYNYGYGTEIDLAKAKEYYVKAAQDGHVEALFHCARFAADGIACKKDPEKTFEYAKKAADRGSENAKGLLARCYSEGIGVEKDKSMGDKLRFEKKESLYYIDGYELLKEGENKHNSLFNTVRYYRYAPDEKDLRYLHPTEYKKQRRKDGDFDIVPIKAECDKEMVASVINYYVLAWVLGIDDASDRLMEIRYMSDNPFKSNLSLIRPERKIPVFQEDEDGFELFNSKEEKIVSDKSVEAWPLLHRMSNVDFLDCLNSVGILYGNNYNQLHYIPTLFLLKEYNTPKYQELAIRDIINVCKSKLWEHFSNIYALTKSDKELLKIMVKLGVEDAIELNEKIMLKGK